MQGESDRDQGRQRCAKTRRVGVRLRGGGTPVRGYGATALGPSWGLGSGYGGLRRTAPRRVGMGKTGKGLWTLVSGWQERTIRSTHSSRCAEAASPSSLPEKPIRVGWRGILSAYFDYGMLLLAVHPPPRGQWCRYTHALGLGFARWIWLLVSTTPSHIREKCRDTARISRHGRQRD